jgi:hypothetical protein bacD2_09648
MKSRKNLFYIGMFALCAIGFAACDDDETYDVYGDPFNRVYISDNSKAYKIVQTPISTVSNVDFKWPAKCSQKASGTIKATVVVDNSLIAAYNEEHGTVFEAMPAEAIVLENAEMTIPAGKMVVADTVHVKLTDDANVLSTLKSEKGYIIPLRLVSAEGPNTQLSTNMVAPSFLTVTVTEDNVNHEATEADITGTLVANQAGWSVNVLSGSGSNLDRWFDGNPQSTASISDWSNYKAAFTADMGKSYTFSAIVAYRGTSWGEYNSISAGTKISTSDDGTNFKSAGEVTGSSKFIVFYAPLTARYIRVETTSYSVNCGVFNVYAK